MNNTTSLCKFRLCLCYTEGFGLTEDDAQASARWRDVHKCNFIRQLLLTYLPPHFPSICNMININHI